MFWCEHLCDLLAYLASTSASGSHRTRRAGVWKYRELGRMKTAALEVQNTNLTSALGRLAADFAELVKARLTLLVLLTTAAGFYLGAEPPIDYVALFHVVFGTALAAAGAAALNQWWERRLDALMHRTRSRPIPAGRMSPRDALVLGCLLSIAGIVYLNLACNSLSALLAAATIVIYIFAYT